MSRLLSTRSVPVSGSLFSGGGVGDFGVEMGCGIPVIAASEIIPSRSQLISKNFPATRVFEGDIWSRHDDYISFFRSQLDGKRPWLLTLSPPCQGMSSNGAGRIASSIRSGIRPKEDDRNRLVLPGISILEKLQPDWFILENVRRMENTIIRNENDQSENILDCLGRRLHPLGYSIRSNILNFSFYGVPHHRERLITIGCRIPHITKNVPCQEKIFSKKLSVFHPPFSHGIDGCPPLISLRHAVGKLPTLDSQTLLVDPHDSLHRVPRWRDNQYFWMKNTPEGKSAFDNFLCIQCSHQNQKKELVTCEKCGEFLPRPTLIRNGEVRLIKGFKTSYRRMKWDTPASTLTMNSGVISSDVKGHPDQHRVLSLREILILSTLDHPRWKKEYSFEGIKYGRPKNQQGFSCKLIREVIGESIPPLAMSCLVNHLRGLE